MALRKRALTTVGAVRAWALKAEEAALSLEIQHDNEAIDAAYADKQAHHARLSAYHSGAAGVLADLLKRLPKG
jgi:hypothetical protein